MASEVRPQEQHKAKADKAADAAVPQGAMVKIVVRTNDGSPKQVVSVPPGTPVSQVLQQLGLTMRKGWVVWVGGDRASTETVLTKDVEVTIGWQIMGGSK